MYVSTGTRRDICRKRYRLKWIYPVIRICTSVCNPSDDGEPENIRRQLNAVASRIISQVIGFICGVQLLSDDNETQT